MAAKPKFVHNVFQTGQPKAMRDWYCTVLDGSVVFEDDVLTFITFDEEHHRVALIAPPVPMEAKSSNTAAFHHSAYTFANLDDLLERYVSLRDQGIRPAVCIAHGITTSLYYRDPDKNMLELQIDVFEKPDDATAYMNGPYYEEDSVGPQFDPEEMLKARRNGATEAELSDREWAKAAKLPPALPILMGQG